MNQKNITIARTDRAAILSLNRNVTNALNLELIREFSAILNTMKQDADIHGIVLTSANDKFFSIGFDIPELYGLPPEEFRVFYQAFNQCCIELFSFPKPAVAAITGHAVAGGCILTLCCDYRYIADGNKKMGLNEIKLGVPIPYPADRILRDLVGSRRHRDMVDSGDFYLPEQSIGMGLVDRIIAGDHLRALAVEKILSLGSYASQAFAMMKQNRIEPVISNIRSSLRQKEEYFLTCWYSESTRRQLQLAMEKF